MFADFTKAQQNLVDQESYNKYRKQLTEDYNGLFRLLAE